MKRPVKEMTAIFDRMFDPPTRHYERREPDKRSVADVLKILERKRKTERR